MKLQVTLFDKNKKYRPISTIVQIESMQYYESHKAEVQKQAILNIMHQRRTTWTELKAQGYTGVKVREYDIEKIKEQKEQQHRINLIKYIERQRKERKESDVK